MVEITLAPPLIRCTCCGQLEELSQMVGIDHRICGPCWLAKVRVGHGTDRREGKNAPV